LKNIDQQEINDEWENVITIEFAKATNKFQEKSSKNEWWDEECI
jgi:hypothetical protein